MKRQFKQQLMNASNLLSISKFEEKTSKILSLILKLSSIFALILIAIITVGTIKDESYIIKPFQVAKSLEENGIYGTVVANSINDKINEIIGGYYQSNDSDQDTSKNKRKLMKIPSENNLQKEKVVLDETTVILKRAALQMEIEGIGINLNPLIGSLQHFIGYQQNYIAGDIAILDSSLIINLRITGYQAIVISKPLHNQNFKDTYNAAIQSSVDYILENLYPSNFLYYCYSKERDSDAVRIANKILSTSETEKKHAYNILGLLAKKQGDNEHALIMFNESLKQDSMFSTVYNNIAICQSEAKEYTKAILNYRKAIKLENDNPSYHKNISICFAKQKLYDDAIEEAKYAVWLKNNNTSYLRNLATIYRKAEKYNEAIKVYEECLRLDINSAKTYNSISVVYQYKGDFTKSYQYANKSLSVDSTYSYAYSTIAENNALQKDSNEYKKNLLLALKYKYPIEKLRINEIHIKYINEIKFDSIIRLLNPDEDK